MDTVKKDSIYEFTEKKSVFIGQVFYAKTIDEAMEKVQSVREAHPDATHVCWAYSVCGGTQRRASDDGEPQGTAGMPILHVLDTNGVADVVCTVTRYFGGILLGAGGLVRAYSKGAAGAIELAGKTDVIEYKTISITYGYDLHSSIERFFRLEELEPLDREFSDKVTLYVEMPAEKFPYVTHTIEEQWYGRVDILELSSEIRRRT